MDLEAQANYDLHKKEVDNDVVELNSNVSSITLALPIEWTPKMRNLFIQNTFNFYDLMNDLVNEGIDVK